MRFDIVTLFPDFFISPLSSGLMCKALAKKIAEVNLVNPRDFTTDKHRKVDDEPYGGGVGM
ncbi:MAG: tRNA (guanosine(37)-N1)-methyltransferase TrmD, partial [Chroococcidiopsis sp.]